MLLRAEFGLKRPWLLLGPNPAKSQRESERGGSPAFASYAKHCVLNNTKKVAGSLVRLGSIAMDRFRLGV